MFLFNLGHGARGKAAPTLGTFTVPAKVHTSVPFTLTAPTSNSAGTWSYTSSNTSVATVSGSTVTIIAAGNSTITATQAETSTHTSGVRTAPLSVTTDVLGYFSVRANGYRYLGPNYATFYVARITSAEVGAWTAGACPSPQTGEVRYNAQADPSPGDYTPYMYVACYQSDYAAVKASAITAYRNTQTGAWTNPLLTRRGLSTVRATVNIGVNAIILNIYAA